MVNSILGTKFEKIESARLESVMFRNRTNVNKGSIMNTSCIN